jgi:hypothetical protein
MGLLRMAVRGAMYEGRKTKPQLSPGEQWRVAKEVMKAKGCTFSEAKQSSLYKDSCQRIARGENLLSSNPRSNKILVRGKTGKASLANLL